MFCVYISFLCVLWFSLKYNSSRPDLIISYGTVMVYIFLFLSSNIDLGYNLEVC